jgi:gluconate 2-dehydrogenase gamma chain
MTYGRTTTLRDIQTPDLTDAPHQCVTRRTLLAGAAFGAVGIASAFTADWRALADGLEPVPPNPPYAAAYFTATERNFVAAATSCLIPTDGSGPGATEADVATFIDRQLAGPYGRGEGWYLAGPFPAGTPEQGWQSELSPAQIYRKAIAAIDAYCIRTAGKAFAKLGAEQQDGVMRGLQKGEIVLDGLSAKTFFQLLHQNTIEAYFADPVYGGNRNFVGWRMIGYPGVRYDWRPWIARHGSRVDWPVVGLYGPGDHYGLRTP